VAAGSGVSVAEGMSVSVGMGVLVSVGDGVVVGCGVVVWVAEAMGTCAGLSTQLLIKATNKIVKVIIRKHLDISNSHFYFE
jgi:hypothetical protein